MTKLEDSFVNARRTVTNSTLISSTIRTSWWCSYSIVVPLYCLLLFAWSATAGQSPKPLPNLHAHNDYEHKRPLLDALDHGFCSVEADVFLVEEKLLVAHTRNQIKPERTLEKLYLEPLRQRIKTNGGRVYPGGPPVTLLIDIKSDWKTLYPVLRESLKQYAEILTTFRGERTETNAILAIITGNRSSEMFAGETVRYAALDGSLDDLDSAAPASLIPLISTDWKQTFRWSGSGPMPEQEKRKLKQIVTQTHEEGRRLRFWGAPDVPGFWREMLEAGVDLINTDDLEGAQQFMLRR